MTTTRWIVLAVVLVLLVGIVLYVYYHPRPQPDCAFSGWKNTVGLDVDAGVSELKKAGGVRAKLNLTEGQVRELDDLLRDYAFKYDTACADLKAGRMKEAEYTCLRRNMEEVLDTMRGFSKAVESAKGGADPTAQARIILDAIGRLHGANCSSAMNVDPKKLTFDDHAWEHSIRIANGGNNDFRFTVVGLPEAFSPNPSTGSVRVGETTQIQILRVALPANASQSVTFTVRNNYNEEKPIEIVMSDENAGLYRDLAREIAAAPTLDAALAVADRTMPADIANRDAARHLFAASLLTEAGAQEKAETALATAVAKSPQLAEQPSVLLLDGLVKKRAGKAPAALESFNKAAAAAGPSHPSAEATAKLFAGSMELKTQEKQPAALEKLATPEVANRALSDPAMKKFVEHEFQIDDVEKTVRSAGYRGTPNKMPSKFNRVPG